MGTFKRKKNKEGNEKEKKKWRKGKIETGAEKRLERFKRVSEERHFETWKGGVKRNWDFEETRKKGKTREKG